MDILPWLMRCNSPLSRYHVVVSACSNVQFVSDSLVRVVLPVSFFFFWGGVRMSLRCPLSSRPSILLELLLKSSCVTCRGRWTIWLIYIVKKSILPKTYFWRNFKLGLPLQMYKKSLSILNNSERCKKYVEIMKSWNFFLPEKN